MTLGQGFSLSPLLSPRIHSCYTCQRNGLQRSHRGATNNSSLSQANSLSAGQPRSMQPAGLCNQPIHGRKGWWWYTMLRAHVMHQRLNEYLRCNDMENVVATQHFIATVQPANNMVNTTSSTMDTAATTTQTLLKVKGVDISIFPAKRCESQAATFWLVFHLIGHSQIASELALLDFFSNDRRFKAISKYGHYNLLSCYNCHNASQYSL